MLLQQFSELQVIVPGAPTQERLVRAGEIRLVVLYDAPYLLKDRLLRIYDSSHTTVEQQAAEVFQPCNPYAFETAVERLREDAARLINGNRRAPVESGHNAQQQRHVF